MDGHPGFERQSSQRKLLRSSPLDTLVRRTSSRRRQPAVEQQTHRFQANASITIPPSVQPRDCASSPTSLHVPESPLLHSNFRNSTASAATNITALHANRSSRSFLSFDDVGPDESGYYREDDGSHTRYSDSGEPPVSTHAPNSWPQVTPSNYSDSEDLSMYPPATLPTVVVSSPQEDDPKSNSPTRQRIVSQSGSPRLNFSRPGRPPILSSEEQKRHVLERNSQRPNSPKMSLSLSPVTPVAGLCADEFDMPGHAEPRLLPSCLHPGVRSPSLASPNHVTLPSHPPSLRPGSTVSLYSDTYSFYQLDSTPSSPTSQSTRSSPDISPATSRLPSAEPQTPEDYLQLGIQYHEANQLADSANYFEKSAKEQGGCGVGMLMWGLTLRHGWGCEKNEKNGFRWLTKAAESAVHDLEKAKKGLDVGGVKEELVLAIYEVGQCFYQGWGVAKDQKMAINYYRVAAKLGDADAQHDLAFCLANGKGCKKDKKEAAKWYRAAVAQGVSDIGMAWIYKKKYED